MYKLSKMCFAFLMLLLIFSCKDKDGKEIPKQHEKTDWEAKGDAKIEVFKNAPIVFDGTAVPDGYHEPDKNGIIRLVNGRLILKKIELPAYERDVKLKLKVRLTSTGDPYDRSGSIFILSSKKQGVGPIDIAKNEKYPEMEGELNKYPGIIKLSDYEPCVEAMRFMTPFGVGYYSQGYEDQLPLPEEIDAWEKDVKWECDISHLYSLLEGDEVYIGAWIDTWVRGGFAIDTTLEIKESKENAPMKKYKVLPLMNTVLYIGQKYPDIFGYVSTKGIDVKTDLTLKDLSEASLYYTTTGHGGYGPEGDEFSQKENIISANGTQLKTWIPWIDSCKEYRKWNPTSAVFQDGVASSDLARSNWCPGSIVKPEEIKIVPSSVGISKDVPLIFNFAIPKANKSQGDKTDFWLVSSYLVYR